MHVVVNAAMSADGKLSTRARTQIPISGPSDFARVDRLRASVDAVVVGVGTVLADNPRLTIDDATAREHPVTDGEPTQPARVVVDSRGRAPLDARVFDTSASSITLVSESAPTARLDALRGASVSVITAGDDRVDLSAGFAALEEHGIDRVLVEGGGELIFSLFEADLVDEVSLFLGSVVIGGADAPTLADGEGFTEPDAFPKLRLRSVERVDDGVLLRWSVRETRA